VIMIQLEIVTPTGIFFSGEVSSFTVPSCKGPLLIEGRYTPIYEKLQPYGVLKIVDKKGNRFFAIFAGQVSVDDKKALICCEDIEDGYDIDIARAIASRDRAQDRLSHVDPNLDVARAKASLERALARISAKSYAEGGN
jgi:F-type H+-transporting ATPase subunit epsilon